MSEFVGATVRTLPENYTSPWTARAERLQLNRERREAARALIVQILQNEKFNPGEKGANSVSPDHWKKGLSASESEELESKWGQAGLQELASLTQESDLAFLGDALLVFAQARFQEGRSEQAFQVWNVLSQAQEFPESIRTQARDQSLAMTGQGKAGLRAEFLFQHLVQETMDPATFLALGLCAPVSRVSRLWSLSALSNTSLKVWEANALSRLIAFGIEAPVFALSAKAGHSFLGRSENWSAPQVGREILSSYLFLGAMKLSGSAMEAALEWRTGSQLVAAPSRWQAFSQTFLPQASMLGGIYLSRALETHFSLRPKQDAANALVESLALLLQFNVAGTLSQGMLGEGFRSWEKQVEGRAQQLLSRNSKSGPFNFGGPLLAMEGPANLPASNAWNQSEMSEVRKFSNLSAMVMQETAGGSKSKHESEAISKHVDRLLESLPAEASNLDPRLRRLGSDRLRELLASAHAPDVLETLLQVEEGRHPEVSLPEFLFAMGVEGRSGESTAEIWSSIQGRLVPRNETVHLYRGLNGVEIKVWKLAELLNSRITNQEKTNLLKIWRTELGKVDPELEKQGQEIEALLAQEPLDSIRVSFPVENKLAEVFRNSSMDHMYFTEDPDGDAAHFARIHGRLLSLKLPNKVLRQMTRIGSRNVALKKNDQNLRLMARFFKLEDLIEGKGAVEDHLAQAPRGLSILNHPFDASDLADGLPFYFPGAFRSLLQSASQVPEIKSLPNRFAVMKGIKKLDQVIQAGEGGRWQDSLATISEDPALAYRFLRDLHQFGLPEIYPVHDLDLSPLSPVDRDLRYPSDIKSLLDQLRKTKEDPQYLEGSREELLAKRMRLSELDRIYFHQTIDFARRVGAKVKVIDVTQLEINDPAGTHAPNPTLLRKALAHLGIHSASGTAARQVLEVWFPLKYLVKVCAMPSDTKMSWLSIFPQTESSEIKWNNVAQLFMGESGWFRTRVVSPSMSEALNLAVHGPEASRIFPVWDLLPRDRTMDLRAKGLTPSGFSDQPAYFGDVRGDVHPSSITAHDLQIHLPHEGGIAGKDKQSASALYSDIQTTFSRNSIKEQTLDRLSDLNLERPNFPGKIDWPEFLFDEFHQKLIEIGNASQSVDAKGDLQEAERFLQDFAAWKENALAQYPELPPSEMNSAYERAVEKLALVKAALSPNP